MELKQRDNDLVGVLQKLNTDEKEEIAKALKYNDFTELKNNYNGESDDLSLEKEIRYVGSDWIKHGVFGGDWATYREVVCGVAKAVKAKYTDKMTTEEIERKILKSIVDKAWEKMDENKRQEYEKDICEFEERLRVENPEKFKKLLEYFKVKSLRGVVPGTLLSAGIVFEVGGFASYQILVIVMSAIARKLGAKIAMNTVTKATALVVPGLNIAMAIWMVWDVARIISGPAMRKVVHVVPLLCTARIRQRSDMN